VLIHSISLTNILYKQEKLPFTCNPTGVAAQTGLITDIILWKNSTLGWKEIVKRRSFVKEINRNN
jgi:hypothetical protein